MKILTCHVAAARAFSGDLMSMIDADGGTHAVETVGGCRIRATYDGDKVLLEDENGGVASVTVADVEQSNGVIHVIDTVLLPKL